MSIYDERETGFEAKFAHDEELKFLALARRDKLFALWAAERLSVTGIARTKVIHDLLGVQGFPGHDTALLRLAADRFVAAGLSTSDLPAALDQLGKEAREQLMGGTAAPIDIGPDGPE